MKMMQSMKKLALGSTIFALSALSMSVYAAAKPNLKDSGGDSGSLSQIASKIYGVVQTAYVQSNARLQQVDNYIDSFINANTPVYIPLQASTAVLPTAANNPNLLPQKTINNIATTVQSANSLATNNSSLAQIPYTASMASALNKTITAKLFQSTSTLYLPWYKIFIDNSPTGSLLLDQKNLPTNTPDSYLTNLTTGIPASDSFMSSSPMLSPQDRQRAVMNNNYFNFMNYFAPTNGAYSTTPVAGLPNVNTDINMARGYAEFLSLSNQPIGQDLSKVLKLYEMNGQINPVYIKTLAGIMKGTNYQDSYKKFLLSERQYYASNSLINGLLSQIWAERAPVKNAALNITAKLDPTTKQQVIQQYFNPNDPTSASPLQIERYNRTHRVNDPQWYQQMRTASPATIAREQLFVSAQILAADQQAHEDREKQLLATLLSAQDYVQNTLHRNLTLSERTLKADLCQALGSSAQGVCSSGDTAKKSTK